MNIEAIVQYWAEYIKDGLKQYAFINPLFLSTSIYSIVNDCFKQEYVGYWFVDGIITPISDEFELEAISQAMESEYKVVYEHLSKANSLIADRKSPDYENSIK